MVYIGSGLDEQEVKIINEQVIFQLARLLRVYLSAKVSYFRGGKLSHVENITACLVRGRFLAKEWLAEAKLKWLDDGTPAYSTRVG